MSCGYSKCVPSTYENNDTIETEPVISKVLPFLFIGGLVAAFRDDILTKYGITHIINATNADDRNDVYKWDGYLHVPQDCAIYEWFNPVIRFIRESRGRVFIYSSQGKNRSAVLVAAYLLVHNKRIDADGALTMVTESHPIADISIDSCLALYEFNKKRMATIILMAISRGKYGIVPDTYMLSVVMEYYSKYS